tara:strand:- start:179 stop:2566 length:2388 start_codon:yes stop_codon:yes gene_type:complete
MAESIITNFPSQVVSDAEKISLEYGLKVAQAIEKEWFEGSSSNRYSLSKRKYHNLRKYARGEQSVQKYKNELSINGDLSYLNLDWTPVPIISKFVDIVVNGMAQRTYDIKAYSQDEYGMAKRTKYMESVLTDMRTREFNDTAKSTLNIDLYKNDPELLPETEEELSLHMQLTYKQEVEIANEQAINVLLEGSKYDLIRTRCLYDLTVCGIGCVKTTFNWSEGAKVEYVDPSSIVYSHSESPYFDDIYYIGEVKNIPINELVREFPELTENDLKKFKSKRNRLRAGDVTHDDADSNKVQILYFNYKTYMNDVYKIKTTSSGGEKAIEKSDLFNPPKDKMTDYSKMQRSVEVLFEGAIVLGTDKLLKWKKADNMMREKSDFNKVKMNYSLVAPQIYNGKISSLVSRITGFADMIQLTHLKLQQVLARMVPDGVYLDADGLAEIDLGNGTNYNPQEALNMFFQTGSVIGRSFTSEGDQNPGKIPIQQISNAGGGQKMQSLIQTYNYYLQMIRDVTGLNEARDASTPDKNSLVGVQKLAAANSNVATRHILNSQLFLTSETCEALSLRISDIIEYSPTKEAFIQQIGAHNVATLSEMSELHLYDFGIFIELMPDEEEKQMLEQNIQMAINQKLIDLDDAIDLREIRNLKMANQMLKIKRKKKAERDQAIQQENIKAQSEANTQSQQAAAQSEIQKNQAKAQSEMEMEKQKNDMKIVYMKEEAKMKRDLMDHEFEINKKLREMDNAATASDEFKEDRKDQRVKMQDDLKKNGETPKNFESAGNDSMGAGSGISIGGLTNN